MKLAVVILAAGASSRMGRPKLLLPWAGTTVIEHLLGLWRSVGVVQLAVVCNPANVALSAELDRIGVSASQRIINPDPARGMFSSIQRAARWNGWQPGMTHWAIALGDQPLVRANTLRGLIQFAAADPRPVCQPARLGRGRHPVVLSAEVFARLTESPAKDLKEFLSSYESGRWESDDAGLDLDLDEPADYEKALSLEHDSTPTIAG